MELLQLPLIMLAHLQASSTKIEPGSLGEAVTEGREVCGSQELTQNLFLMSCLATIAP